MLETEQMRENEDHRRGRGEPVYNVQYCSDETGCHVGHPRDENIPFPLAFYARISLPEFRGALEILHGKGSSFYSVNEQPLTEKITKQRTTRREFFREILYNNIAIIAIQHSTINFVDIFGDFSHTVELNSLKSVWQTSLYILA